MAYVVFDHYVQIMETWYLLVFILLLKPLKRLPTGWQCSMAVITACLIFAGARYHTRQLQENNYMVIDIEIIPEIVPEASKVMQADWKSTERPRILYYGTVGFDLGRALDPLPAGRYWFTQFYSGHKFIDRQRDYILHREPDYVFTMDIDNIDPAKWNFSQASALLKRAGYRLIYTTKAYESIYTFYLYRKAN